MPKKVPFVHKLLTRIGRLDPATLQNYVEGLVHERTVYEEILDHLNEGVLLVHASGTLQAVNRQAAAWLSLDPEKSKRKSIQQLLMDSELSRFILDHLKGLQGKVVGEIRLLTPKEIQLQVVLAPLGESSEDTTLVLLSERAAAQAEQDERTSRIETLVRLASGIAHEIGNPLNAIGIHLALLKKQIRSLPENKRGDLEKNIGVLHHETDRLDKIVRNFLRATRRPPLRFRAENLNSILEGAVDFMRPELARAKIAVPIKTDRALPEFLMDRSRLHQTFINLIKNAKEAMPDGGALKISVAHQDRLAMIKFKDTGSGIAEEDLPHIFEAYYTTKEGGSGLGLMTVFDAVREHGGRIEVQTKPGQGTTFILLLPIRQPKLQLPEYRNSK